MGADKNEGGYPSICWELADGRNRTRPGQKQEMADASIKRKRSWPKTSMRIGRKQKENKNKNKNKKETQKNEESDGNKRRE